MPRYIDADKLFEKVGSIKPADKDHYKYIGEFMNLITYSPTADVRENVKGEWISTGFMEVKCSNCKETFHELESANFCPNCGAEMKGDNNAKI